MVPLSNNRIGWSIGGRSDAEGASYWSLSQEEASTSFSKFPDWIEAEQDSIEEICRQCRTKPNPFGMGTYGDLIDKTPKNLISRVMFEEKGFRTWYGGRTVLIGDGEFEFCGRPFFIFWYKKSEATCESLGRNEQSETNYRSIHCLDVC